MSQFSRTHPDLIGTDSDFAMDNTAHAAAHRELAMEESIRTNFGRSLDSLIAEAKERQGSRVCECGHRFDRHDPDPPGGGCCEVFTTADGACSCRGFEEDC